tara:strand:- start:2346 stop:3857 length:1512 start_codon:yes stop_codon:yes gene_type:complete
MRKIIIIFIIVSFGFSVNTNRKLEIEAPMLVPIVLNELKAFPTAEGFGKTTTGGRGGTIYHVTSLADTNTSGTLRYGVETLTGARTIVFDVGGYIDMTGSMKVRNGYGDLTILAHTAPSPGVSLRYGNVLVHDDNVIIRGLRIRMGKAFDYPDALPSDDPNYEPPPAFTLRGFATPLSGFIIDHCSFVWGKDGNLDIWSSGTASNMQNITVQKSILSENVDKGYNSVNKAQRVTHWRNLLSNCSDRNPSFTGANSSAELVNNLVYNRDSGGNTSWGSLIDYVNQMYLNTPQGHYVNAVELTQGTTGGVLANTRSYVTGSVEMDNLANIDSGVNITYNSALNPYITTSRNMDSGVPVIATGQTMIDAILGDVGDIVNQDAVDARIIADVVAGTGARIQNESEVGGYPTLTSSTRAGGFYSTLADIPESFVTEHSITSANQNKINWTFGTQEVTNNVGYTAFEMYTFSLLNDFGTYIATSTPTGTTAGVTTLTGKKSGNAILIAN